MHQYTVILLLLANTAAGAVWSAFTNANRIQLGDIVMFPVAGSVSNFYATNYGTPVAWYVGDNANITPSPSNAIANWPDDWGDWDLTNWLNWSRCPFAQTNSLNGHHTVKFDGVDDYLRCINYTNIQPYEMWVVAKVAFTNPAVQQTMFDSCSSAGRAKFYLLDADAKIGQYAGAWSDVAFGGNKTNKWYVWTVIWSSTISRWRTNNVQMRVGNAGTANPSGLTLGAQASLADPGPWEFAEMCVYSATNDAANAAALYSGFTNKYGVSNF